MLTFDEEEEAKKVEQILSVDDLEDNQEKGNANNK